jgi:dihydrofolate reductase
MATSMPRSKPCCSAELLTSKACSSPEWRYADKPYWVFSSTTGNTPASVLAEMQARGLRRAWLVGGGRLAAAFRGERLITEHIISIVPVVLGAGIPLFDGPGPRETLRLKSSRSYPNGIVQLRYETLL